MCGRFSFAYEDWSEVIAAFGLDAESPEFSRRYNVAPSQMVPAIVMDGESRKIGSLRWGLVPSFAKDDKNSYKMINVRAQTLVNRPTFQRLLLRKRCLIPASGFYEWKREGHLKEPMHIKLKGRNLFALAGLYDTWIDSDGKRMSTCTIITTEPNDLMRTIHNRMPVILSREHEALWLNKSENNLDNLLTILQTYPAKQMRAYPVSPLVNHVQNDSPTCLAPFQNSFRQSTLF